MVDINCTSVRKQSLKLESTYAFNWLCFLIVLSYGLPSSDVRASLIRSLQGGVMHSTDPVRSVGNPCSSDTLSHGVTASPTFSFFFFFL